jgi:hypothetical protein
MKKQLAFLMVFVLVSCIAVMAASTTLTGMITDDMCGAKHMMAGKSDPECIRACVREGAKFALLVGDKLYVLSGMNSEVSALAGKKVTITGTVKDNTLTVATIQAAK